MARFFLGSKELYHSKKGSQDFIEKADSPPESVSRLGHWAKKPIFKLSGARLKARLTAFPESSMNRIIQSFY
jgi:hypothetical protein